MSNEPNKASAAVAHTPGPTPITDEAVSRIERKHTHVAKNVTTNYKAAFIELGFEMGELEHHSANTHAELLAALEALLCHFSHEPPMECYATDAQYTNAKKLFGTAREALAKAKGAAK